MRKLYVKCSDSRSRKFSIVTSIMEDKGKKYVLKSPVFQEGNEHIKQMMKNSEILNCAYSDVDICAAELVGESIRFEYIDGESLADEYVKLILEEDKQGILKLIDKHLEIVKGDLKNECEFYETEISRNVFGEMSEFVGEIALKVSNFEATARNIFVTNNRYVFIDYEWVFNVPIPLELIIYHCIVATGYSTISGLDNLISKNELLKYLGISERMKGTWANFFNYITLDSVGIDYAYAKSKYEKNTLVNSNIEEIKHENKGHKQYIDILEKSLKDQNEYVSMIEKNNKDQQIYIEEVEKNSQEKQLYIESLVIETNDNINLIMSLKDELKNAEEIISNLDKELEEIKSSKMREIFKIFRK